MFILISLDALVIIRFLVGDCVLNKEKPLLAAKACVIWLHGLGSNADDMAGLAAQIPLPSSLLHHVTLEAQVRPVTVNGGMPMRAWFDIVGMKITDREDRQGITQSQQLVIEAIEQQKALGFRAEQIFLAGFSQGGAMALYTALHCTYPLAGIIALSAYLPLASEARALIDKSTPIFIAGGQYDPVVLPAWTKASADWLALKNYQNLSVHTYPMEHSICQQEISDLAHWLIHYVEGIKK